MVINLKVMAFQSKTTGIQLQQAQIVYVASFSNVQKIWNLLVSQDSFFDNLLLFSKTHVGIWTQKLGDVNLLRISHLPGSPNEMDMGVQKRHI